MSKRKNKKKNLYVQINNKTTDFFFNYIRKPSLLLTCTKLKTNYGDTQSSWAKSVFHGEAGHLFVQFNGANERIFPIICHVSHFLIHCCGLLSDINNDLSLQECCWFWWCFGSLFLDHWWCSIGRNVRLHWPKYVENQGGSS